MKRIISSSLFIIFIFTSNAWAIEPIEGQQALLYYQIPFGGVKKVDNTHKFGFRVDRVSIDRSTGQYSDSVSFNDLMKRPASLDVQIGHSGITAFKMHGHDYLPQMISKAEEGDTEADAGTPGEAEDIPGEAEGKKEKELPSISDVVFEQTTFGILLGAGIAVIALTGAGG